MEPLRSDCLKTQTLRYHSMEKMAVAMAVSTSLVEFANSLSCSTVRLIPGVTEQNER